MQRVPCAPASVQRFLTRVCSLNSLLSASSQRAAFSRTSPSFCGSSPAGLLPASPQRVVRRPCLARSLATGAGAEGPAQVSGETHAHTHTHTQSHTHIHTHTVTHTHTQCIQRVWCRVQRIASRQQTHASRPPLPFSACPAISPPPLPALPYRPLPYPSLPAPPYRPPPDPLPPSCRPPPPPARPVRGTMRRTTT